MVGAFIVPRLLPMWLVLGLFQMFDTKTIPIPDGEIASEYELLRVCGIYNDGRYDILGDFDLSDAIDNDTDGADSSATFDMSLANKLADDRMSELQYERAKHCVDIHERVHEDVVSRDICAQWEYSEVDKYIVDVPVHEIEYYGPIFRGTRTWIINAYK